jgi:hypothetical protein
VSAAARSRRLRRCTAGQLRREPFATPILGNLRFDQQIEIESAGDGSFSDGGDSGSLIVDDDFGAVGLLFAGSEAGGENGLGLTFANPIGTVLDALKVDLALDH